MPDLLPFEAKSAEHLRLAIENGHIGVWELDLKSGRAVRNSTHDAIFGYEDRQIDWTYDHFLSHVVEEDRERVHALQTEAIREGREWAFQCPITTAKGQARWISAAGRPLRGEDGEVERLIGHVIDITQTKQKEARLQLVTEELNHRVLNMLAMVKSMVRLSSARATDIASFVTALEARVGALARSHSILVDDSLSPFKPVQLLQEELRALPDLGQRVIIRGELDVEVASAAGRGVALVFHELLTNALKYGALSGPDGKVLVEFATTATSLTISWIESGGPVVEEGKRPGFGLSLLSRALSPHGTARLSLPPSGAVCEIEIERL